MRMLFHTCSVFPTSGMTARDITNIFATTNLKLLTNHNKEAKENIIILDLVMDHSMTHIMENKTSKEMNDSLVALYQSLSVSRKMLLINKLSTICGSDTNTMVIYLVKIIDLRYQLDTIGTKVDIDEELVPWNYLKWFCFILETIFPRCLCS
jgi:hypothetical protein